MGERFLNSEYGFACRIDNLKEASKGNKVFSGLVVSEESTPAMGVDFTAGSVRVNSVVVSVSADNVSVTASSSENDRYDLVSVDDSGTVSVTAGTPASNPLPPDLPENEVALALIFVEKDCTEINDGDISDMRIIEQDFSVPIGTVLSWVKTLTGVPSLPANFVECNGQVLSDAESPLNGQTIPDLNGDNRFLRGNSTSGGTGGSENVTLTTTELPAHTHTIGRSSSAVGDGTSGNATSDANNNGTITSSSTGTGSAFSILPKYYNIVWIMRVK
jgi:hypothetical protein